MALRTQLNKALKRITEKPGSLRPVIASGFVSSEVENQTGLVLPLRSRYTLTQDLIIGTVTSYVDEPIGQILGKTLITGSFFKCRQSILAAKMNAILHIVNSDGSAVSAGGLEVGLGNLTANGEEFDTLGASNAAYESIIEGGSHPQTSVDTTGASRQMTVLASDGARGRTPTSSTGQTSTISFNIVAQWEANDIVITLKAGTTIDIWSIPLNTNGVN